MNRRRDIARTSESFTSGQAPPSRRAYLLAGLIPDARVKIYPDAAHGCLFQHHAEFAAGVDAFLAGAG